MTVNAALGLAGPNAAAARTGSRSVTGAEAAGQGFDDALSGGAGKRRIADAREHGESSRPSWKIEAYGARLNLQAEDAQGAAALDDADADFAVLLDEALAEPGAESTAEDGEAAPVNEDALLDLLAAEGTVSAPVAFAPPAGAIDAEAGDGDEGGIEPDARSERGQRRATSGEPFAASRRGEAAEGGAPRSAATAAAAASRTAPDAGSAAGERPAASRAQPAPDQPALSAAGAQARSAAPPAGSTSPEQAERPAAGSPRADLARSGGANDALLSREPAVRAFAPASAADAIAARVGVLGFSAAPSPAATPLLGATAAGLVSAIGADPGMRAAAQEAGAPGGQRGQAPSGVSTLRIQLHPAELGMVTARLTATGSQLSIEIQVESNDARQRLATDSDAILKALRTVGFDVEKVTIQQVQPGGSGNAQQGAAGRDQTLSNQQARDGDGARGQSGRNQAGGDGEGARHGAGEAAADRRPGGGLYI